MRFPYIPRGDGEEQAMLDAIGAESFDDLVAPVPKKYRLSGLLDLPEPKSEYEIFRAMTALAEKNAGGGRMFSFLGAGSYEHIIPAAVDHLSFRSEFYTAYTPYQPEVGQGTLTTIFEFQTMMAEMTQMDLVNASLYDGATALAEAVLLAVSVTKRKKIVIAGPIHPHYLQVLRTLTQWQEIEVRHDPALQGMVDRGWLGDALAEQPAAVVAQTPNFFGTVEDLTEVFASAAAAGAKSIVVFEPHALALYKTPGEMGADLAVGEGLSLGTAPTFGGPALGLFAARKEFARQIPGRLIGETVDRNGKRAYVMTLQTREQHIRRERATSNICTNQGLLALRATIYLSLMGPKGMREVAEQCLQRAHYAADRISAIDGFQLRYAEPFFHEFVVECPRPAREVVEAARAFNVIPGLDLGCFSGEWNHDPSRLLLVSATEVHARADLEALITALEESANV